MLGMTVKEMIFGGISVINTGLNITNLVIGAKNRRDVKDLRSELNQFAIKASPTPAPAQAPTPTPAANLAEAKEVVDKLSAVVEGARELMNAANAETVTPETVTPEVVTPEVVTPETVTPEVVTPEEKKTNEDQKPNKNNKK